VGEQERVHELLRRHGGKIIFKGHDHVYVHEIVDGIHYLTCARNSGFRGRNPRWIQQTGFEELYPGGFDLTPGYHRVTVSPRSLEVELVDEEGRVCDAFVIEDRGSF